MKIVQYTIHGSPRKEKQFLVGRFICSQEDKRSDGVKSLC